MPRTRASASHLFVPRKATRAEQRAARAGFAAARHKARRATAPPKHRVVDTLDPQLRPSAPRDYPQSWGAWLAMGLFALAFEPLFLCFAPYAFFVRLFRRQELALALTVSWGIYILALRLGASPKLPPMWVVAELMALRLLSGVGWVYFYLKGGALLIWWMVLLVHLRFVADLFSTA